MTTSNLRYSYATRVPQYKLSELACRCFARHKGSQKHASLVILASLLATLTLATPAPAHATETFGIEAFSSSIASNPEGTLATQAGSHPYALTTTIMFSHELTEEKESFRENLNEEEVPLKEPDISTRIDGNPRDLEVNLPSGLTVDPAATAVKCTEAQLETSPSAGGSCPASSAAWTSRPTPSTCPLTM